MVRKSVTSHLSVSVGRMKSWLAKENGVEYFALVGTPVIGEPSM